ncbi:RNA methyltransferase [Ureaplasma sp. ES3154-GEN]|uniref:TrmH family RNA methyltransferase n=1 Tax=Ureaplasma sp. ES3154-GEN TaxID=2984844 RepID=UPI0021E91FED|nr:RNA methyltransferase [Ureaplasma sp. ES3154-GEN]MCV3743335.1 RNA methyltransferase [Ureaplasma sp. ES3154-GEN]
MQIITSNKNPLIIHAAKLVADKKYRDEHQAFVIEGIKLLDEAINNQAVITHLFVTNSFYDKNYEQFFPYTLINNITIIQISDQVAKKISSNVQSGHLFGLVKMINKPLAMKKSILFLDHIQDPGNLGTILRSAVSFNVQNIVLYNCADLYNPKTIKAAMGATFKINVLNINQKQTAVDFLKKIQLTKIATALHKNATPLHQFHNTNPYCLLVGNEGHGLDEIFINLADHIVQIMLSNTESLNVTNATSIFMYALNYES